jgi:hypothetical protein
MDKPLSALQVSTALADAGFRLQRNHGDFVLVRPSDREDLFERIDIDFAGRRSEAIVLTIALTVVSSVKAQARGLSMSRGIPELRGEEGRIEFRSKPEAKAWLERLAQTAPTRLREFANESGSELLARTDHARRTARHAFTTILPALRPLSDEESQLKSKLMEHPLFAGADDVSDEYDKAITALLIAGDPDLVSYAKSPPMARSDVALWKVRLLVDLQLRAPVRSDT